MHGHQDNNNDPNTLSPIAQINIAMHALVGEYIDNMDPQRDYSEPTFFPAQQVCIVINKQRRATDITDLLMYHNQYDKIHRHFENVVKIPQTALSSIQWRGYRLVMRERKNKDPTLKATHQQWQTMHVCKKWKLSTNATCPLCQQCDEHWDHVLQCNNEHISRLRKEHLHKFKKTMNEIKTNNIL